MNTKSKIEPQPKSQRRRRVVNKELEEMRHLHAIGAGLVRETDLQKLLNLVLKAAIEITQADFGNVQFVDPQVGRLRIVAQYGFDRHFIDFFENDPKRVATCTKALERKSRVIVRDVASDPIFRGSRARAVMLEAKARACQSTPLFSTTGEVFGILSTHYRKPRRPPQRSLRFLDLLARQAAELIERTRHREWLEAEVAERTRELEEKNFELMKQADTVHELSGRLLRVQDEERRRIARDLHDITGQEIGSIALTLGHLSRNFGKPGLDVKKVISENAAVAHKISEDIRTLSYLLHPPLLDELGLGSAVRWYGEGFEKRSGICVEMEGLEDFPRLSADGEIVLFRILQEALTNVHRYSGSATARIQLTMNRGCARLVVEDRGKGMSIPEPDRAKPTAFGVGIPGMRERVLQLGGSLEIESNPNGTRVIATLPFVLMRPPKAPTAAAMLSGLPRPGRIPAAERKRILIVDDHELMRNGNRELLETDTLLDVCAEATDGDEAIEKAREMTPDLIIMDLSMPRLGGMRASIEIRKTRLETKILILTTHASDHLMTVAQRTRYCEGYVQKSMASQDLLLAIHTILNGGTFFPEAEKVKSVSAASAASA